MGHDKGDRPGEIRAAQVAVPGRPARSIELNGTGGLQELAACRSYPPPQLCPIGWFAKIASNHLKALFTAAAIVTPS